MPSCSLPHSTHFNSLNPLGKVCRSAAGRSLERRRLGAPGSAWDATAALQQASVDWRQARVSPPTCWLPNTAPMGPSCHQPICSDQAALPSLPQICSSQATPCRHVATALHRGAACGQGRHARHQACNTSSASRRRASICCQAPCAAATSRASKSACCRSAGRLGQRSTVSCTQVESEKT